MFRISILLTLSTTVCPIQIVPPMETLDHVIPSAPSLSCLKTKVPNVYALIKTKTKKENTRIIKRRYIAGYHTPVSVLNRSFPRNESWCSATSASGRYTLSLCLLSNHRVIPGRLVFLAGREPPRFSLFTNQGRRTGRSMIRTKACAPLPGETSRSEKRYTRSGRSQNWRNADEFSPFHLK